jgi:hypothetical protein
MTSMFDKVDDLYARFFTEDARPEDSREAVETLIQSLAADPLLKRYMARGADPQRLPSNTKPEHAFAERIGAALSCLEAARGDIPILSPLKPESASAAAAGIGAMLLMATVYLWENKIEALADQAPLPKHTVSRNVLPYPLMFWSRETAHVSDEDGGWENNWVGVIHHTDCCFVVGDRIGNDGSVQVAFFPIIYGKVWPHDYPNGATPTIGTILKRCAFLGSPYVVTERRKLPRHIRRQIAREEGGETERLQQEMHVVKLRRLQTRSLAKQGGEPHTVEWQHRWWVSAHYRAQWYPSEEAHRVIWIAPHLKGPDDKPILEKMYAVMR